MKHEPFSLYCAVEGYDGEIRVASFGGRTIAEERRYALSGEKKVYLVTPDYDAAQDRAALERRKTAKV